MKSLKFLLAGLLVAFVFVGQAGAFIVTDVNPVDDNVIFFYIEGPGGTYVEELYGEQTLIPYPSHDGYAVVNGQEQFFDKIFTKGQFDVGLIDISFSVINATPYDWSDYHFEFWDETFTIPIPVPVMDWSNNIFLNSSYGDTDVTFWSPDEQLSGMINVYNLNIDTTALPDSFGIRQIATTTPEPVSSILFIAGGTLLVCRRFFFPKGRN